MGKISRFKINNRLTYEYLLNAFPYRYYSQRVLDIIKLFNMSIIHWNLDTRDWEHYKILTQEVSREGIDLERIFKPSKRLKYGPMILQHDNVTGTAQDQGRVIDYIRMIGYKIVSLDECLGIRRSSLKKISNQKI